VKFMKKTKLNGIKSFTKGFVTATFFSSALLYAGTLVDGVYEFAGGETISASEMNHNFQKIRGNVIVEATNTATIFSQLDSPVQQCENSQTDCNAGYVPLGNVTAGAIETRTDPSASTLFSATSGGDMNYITIPADGFYEVSLIANPTSFTISPPDETYESTNLNLNFSIIKFDSTDASKGDVTSNESAMKTPRVDGMEIYSNIETKSYLRREDTDGDGAEDYFQEDIEGGAKKQVYLKAGDGLAVFYWIYWQNYYTPVNSDNVNFGVGSIKFKVKQIVD
jgi:hypothetical protein